MVCIIIVVSHCSSTFLCIVDECAALKQNTDKMQKLLTIAEQKVKILKQNERKAQILSKEKKPQALIAHKTKSFSGLDS